MKHVEEIYKIICFGWKFYKENYVKYPSEIERIASDANNFAESHSKTDEYDFAKAIMIAVLEQFERERKASGKEIPD